jgi:hypothetical protein
LGARRSRLAEDEVLSLLILIEVDPIAGKEFEQLELVSGNLEIPERPLADFRLPLRSRE